MVLDISTKDYSFYFFSKNPFPKLPIPKEAPEIYSINKEVLSKIFENLSIIKYSTESMHIVMIAPYGAGKTHILKFIKQIITQVSETEEKVLAVYISYPGTRILHLYRKLMLEIGRSRIKRVFNKRDKKQKKNMYGFYDFFLALEQLETENSLLAWRWLLAEKLNYQERNILGLSRNIENSDDVLSALTIMVKLLAEIGFKMVCLLIDEFESLNELQHSQRQKYYNDLRHLIDLNPSNLCLIIACTPAGWNEIHENAFALVRRLSINEIYLEPLNNDESCALVRSYQERCRINEEDLQDEFKKRNIKKETSNKDLSIYPFTKDAISEIKKLSRGITGEMLKYCHIAIEEGIRKKQKWITKATLKEILGRYMV